jgi:hypothetical protein
VVSKSETGGSLCGHLERDLEKATGQVWGSLIQDKRLLSITKIMNSLSIYNPRHELNIKENLTLE